MSRADRRHAVAFLALYLLICVSAAITVARRAERGQGAYPRWVAHTEMLRAGESPYRRSTDPTGLDEGHPNPPMGMLLLMPFHALPAAAGSVAWCVFKGLIAGLVFLLVLRSTHPPWPAFAPWLLLLLSAQVIHLDLTHSNINLVVGGLIVAGVFAGMRDRDFLSGLAIGLAGVLKVTPFLFAPYFAYKRRWKACAGVLTAVALFALLVPGLFLGFDRNMDLLRGWYDQMIGPFLEGKDVGYMQTGHMNQSLTGVLHRLLDDTVAFWAQPQNGIEELRVNVLSLGTTTVAWIVRALSLLVLGVVAWSCRAPEDDREHVGHLGEAALVFLAMLFLSERSWRTHYVLLILPHAFLLYAVTRLQLSSAATRTAAVALGVSALCHHGLFDELFGDAFGRLAESYGVFFLGGAVLFGACVLVMRRIGNAGRVPGGAS